MRRALGFALLGLAWVSPGVSGQSLFGTQGLGTPMEPLDAKARALGTLGVGLFSPTISPVDPASAARIYLPSAQLTFQPHWVNGDLEGQPIDTKGTRFPHVGLAYPVPSANGTALLHFGSYMDQRWEIQRTQTKEFEEGTVPVTDVFKSNGGVSTFQLGWAQRVGNDLSLGLSAGTRMGSVTRAFLRIIEGGDDFNTRSYQTGGKWQYSGFTGSLGVQWDPITAVRLAGSVTWSEELKAEPTDKTAGDTESFRLPIEYRFGASGALTSRLALSVGVYFADWQASDNRLNAESLVGQVWSYGGGLEWAGPQLGARNFPFRLGFRSSGLPFTFEGENPTETLISWGIGLDLIPPRTGYMGGIDLAVEKGTREAAALSESFWRASMTFRVGSF